MNIREHRDNLLTKLENDLVDFSNGMKQNISHTKEKEHNYFSKMFNKTFIKIRNLRDNVDDSFFYILENLCLSEVLINLQVTLSELDKIINGQTPKNKFFRCRNDDMEYKTRKDKL